MSAPDFYSPEMQPAHVGCAQVPGYAGRMLVRDADDQIMWLGQYNGPRIDAGKHLYCGGRIRKIISTGHDGGMLRVTIETDAMHSQRHSS